MVLYPNQLITQAQLPSKYRSAKHNDKPARSDGPQLDLLEQNTVDELFAPTSPLNTDGSAPILLEEPIDLKAKLAELERDLYSCCATAD